MEKNPWDNKYLIVVTGPTAVGKTELCVQLAQRLQTEIISADSRQLYQGMCIGTAQPTQAQLSLVEHHFVNCVPIETAYSAGKFEVDALRLIQRLWHSYKCLIVVGGAGLYLRAICEGLDVMTAIPLSVRQHLNQRFQQEGLTTLAQDLSVLDPAYYKLVDLHNPRRIIRALEVIMATGVPYSQFRCRYTNTSARPFQVIQIGLHMERLWLYDRINHRVDQMMNQGLLAEVMALCPYKQYNSLQTVGYQELFGYLDQQYTLQEAIALIKRNTRRYAKRQLTWLRQQKDITWFGPHEVVAMLNYITMQMKGNIR